MGRRRRRRNKEKRAQQRNFIPFEGIVESVRSGEAFPVIAPGDAILAIVEGHASGLDAEAGHSLAWHRGILTLLMYADIGSVVFGCVVSAMAFGWWALLIIPGLLVAFRIMGRRSHVTASILVLLLLFAAGAVAGVLLWESGAWPAVFAVSLPAPWLIQRIAGRLALRTVTRLVLDKPGVLAMLLAKGDAFLVGEARLPDDPSEE